MSTVETRFWIREWEDVPICVLNSSSVCMGCIDAAVQNVVPLWSFRVTQSCTEGESLGPGWLKVDFLFKEKVDFAWGSGGQRESVVKRTSEADIWFWYKMGILSPLFQAYPHALSVKWLGVWQQEEPGGRYGAMGPVGVSSYNVPRL